jgi:catechol 2,3-dioxygenase-like lactoylglutathione lyase family enzyme
MKIEWQPDADNIYLTSGNDNLALHRATEKPAPKDQQKLDHIGFILNELIEVDRWHEYLASHQIAISKTPQTHRDGARSFYCADPDGNSVQMIYHPPLAKAKD